MDIPTTNTPSVTRKRQRTATIHSFKKSAIIGDVLTFPVLHDKYKYEIEQLGWIMLNPTNTNQINSYQIDLVNLNKSLLLYKRMEQLKTHAEQQSNSANINNIPLMTSHIKLISDFVISHFKTGFVAF